jgi:hypothetical protein
MPTDSHDDDRDEPASELALSPRAEGHLALLRAYFGFQGYFGAVVAALTPLSLLFPPGIVTIQGNPWIVLPLFGLNTWAAFRTRRLLLERHPDGLWMAVATFACNLIAARSAGHIGFGAILSGLGVLLAANVYRELRRATSSPQAPEAPG